MHLTPGRPADSKHIHIEIFWIKQVCLAEINIQLLELKCSHWLLTVLSIEHAAVTPTLKGAFGTLQLCSLKGQYIKSKTNNIKCRILLGA